MHFSFRQHFLLGGLVGVVLFLLLGSWYVDRRLKLDHEQFANHAVVIADEIWAVDRVGVETYLELAAHTNSFNKLCVREPGGRIFAEVDGLPLNSFEIFLVQIKLIRTHSLSKEIFYKGDTIATLHGDKYVHLLLPFFSILVTILLFGVIAVFLRYLFATRRFLQRLVVERTEKLKESENRFEDLVNLLPEMVWETDLDGKITYINKVGYKTFGVTQADKKVFYNLLTEKSRSKAKQKFKETVQGQEPGLQEYYAYALDGRRFPLLLRCSLRYYHSKVVGVRMLGVDISERIKLEEQLHRDRRMKALGLMAGGVAHDLNNILSGVVGYPDILLRQLDKDSQIRGTIKSIKKSGEQAAEVVSDLLTVVRGGVVKKEHTDINALVRDYFESNEFAKLKKNNPHISYDLHLDDKVSLLGCSSMHIRKALMNLVINGTEAVVDQGSVSVITELKEIKSQLECHSGLLEPGKYVVIAVKDTGLGIAQKDLNSIFEPFYSKKVMGKSGTGLGMALVWNAVMDHGGGIQLNSDPNGTLLEMYFPIGNEEASDSLDAKLAKAPPGEEYKHYMGNGEKILVVDDEAQQRDLAEQMLTMLGYNVTCVNSGEKAVAHVKESDVDFVVLDMIMPSGMNGRETYEEILKNKPNQKAIIVSGYADSKDIAKSLKLGVADILTKPYTFEQLGKTVYAVL